jgi:hypothetical protein
VKNFFSYPTFDQIVAHMSLQLDNLSTLSIQLKPEDVTLSAITIQTPSSDMLTASSSPPTPQPSGKASGGLFPSAWKVPSSIVAKRTINPIREVVDRSKVKPNPSKPVISLALGTRSGVC